MKDRAELNWEKEHEISVLLAPVSEAISEAFDELNRLPESAARDDLHTSVRTLSHAFHSINTQPFRVHNSDELPLLEQTIAGLADFISTRLKFLMTQIKELSGA